MPSLRPTTEHYGFTMMIDIKKSNRGRGIIDIGHNMLSININQHQVFKQANTRGTHPHALLRVRRLPIWFSHIAWRVTKPQYYSRLEGFRLTGLPMLRFKDGVHTDTVRLSQPTQRHKRPRYVAA